MADIPVSGIPSGYRKPIWATEILFGAGPSITGGAAKRILVVMPMLASGTTWAANQIVRDVRSESAVIVGAGAGSPCHRAMRAALKVNPEATVDFLPYLPSSGAGLASADLDITWTTTATAAGWTELVIQNEKFRHEYALGATPTEIADAMVTRVNAATHLACSASAALGVLKLTSRIGGASQGDGTTGVIRVSCAVDGSSGTTVATENANSFSALGLGTGATGADGATTEAANLLAALNTIKTRYEYTVISMFDATGVGHLRTHIASNALPKAARRGHGIFAFPGVRGTAATRAIAQNHERLNLILQQRSWYDCAELAMWWASVRQKNEELDLAAGYDEYVDPLFQLAPAYDSADWPDDDDLNNSISDGVTEVGSNAVTSMVAMAVTTRSKDATGAFDEFKASEPHRVVIMDAIADELNETWRRDFKNFKLVGDKYLPDGKVVDTNRSLPARAITPYFARATVIQVFERYEELGLLQDVDTLTKPSLKVQRDPDNTGRLEIGADCRTCDIAHQVTQRFAEVTPG